MKHFFLWGPHPDMVISGFKRRSGKLKIRQFLNINCSNGKHTEVPVTCCLGSCTTNGFEVTERRLGSTRKQQSPLPVMIQ